MEWQSSNTNKTTPGSTSSYGINGLPFAIISEHLQSWAVIRDHRQLSTSFLPISLSGCTNSPFPLLPPLFQPETPPTSAVASFFFVSAVAENCRPTAATITASPQSFSSGGLVSARPPSAAAAAKRGLVAQWRLHDERDAPKVFTPHSNNCVPEFN